MSSASTTTTTIAPRQFASTGGETVVVAQHCEESSVDIAEKNSQTEEEPEDTYLPANHGVTGQESDINPPSWPSNHRRMPPYRQPVRHPEWDAIGGPLPIRVFMWDMFSGCQLLQVYLDARLSVTQSSLLMIHTSGVTLQQGLQGCTIGDTVCTRLETSGDT